MASSVFDIREVFLSAWGAFKKNIFFFLSFPLGFAAVFAFIFSALGALATSAAYINSLLSAFLIFIVAICAAIVLIYFCLIYYKAALAAVKGNPLNWKFLKSSLSQYLKFIVVYVVFALAIFIVLSVLLILIPKLFGLYTLNLFFFFKGLGITISAAFIIYIAVTFFPLLFVAADKKDLSIFDIFSKTYKLTKRNFGSIALFLMVCLGFNIIGFLVFGIGLLITYPIVFLAVATAYKKLDNRR